MAVASEKALQWSNPTSGNASSKTEHRRILYGKKSSGNMNRQEGICKRTKDGKDTKDETEAALGSKGMN